MGLTGRSNFSKRGTSLPSLEIGQTSARVLLDYHSSRNRIQGTVSDIRRKEIDRLLLTRVLKGHGSSVKIVGSAAFLGNVTKCHISNKSQAASSKLIRFLLLVACILLFTPFRKFQQKCPFWGTSRNLQEGAPDCQAPAGAWTFEQSKDAEGKQAWRACHKCFRGNLSSTADCSPP